jgi:hypothetical protein
MNEQSEKEFRKVVELNNRLESLVVHLKRELAAVKNDNVDLNDLIMDKDLEIIAVEAYLKRLMAASNLSEIITILAEIKEYVIELEANEAHDDAHLAAQAQASSIELLTD